MDKIFTLNNVFSRLQIRFLSEMCNSVIQKAHLVSSQHKAELYRRQQPQLQLLHFLMNHLIHVVMGGFGRTEYVSVDRCYLLPLWFLSPDDWLVFCRHVLSVCCTHTLQGDEKRESGQRRKRWQTNTGLTTKTLKSENKKGWKSGELAIRNKTAGMNLIWSSHNLFPQCVCMCWQICYCLSSEIGYWKTHPVII